MKEMLDWILTGSATMAIIVLIINILLIAAIFCTAIHCSYIRKQTLDIESSLDILRKQQKDLYEVQYNIGKQNKEIISLLQSIESNTHNAQNVQAPYSSQLQSQQQSQQYGHQYQNI